MTQSNAATLGQEIANAITHGIGVLLSISALVILVVFASLRGDAWYIAAYAVFGVSMITLYLASTLYHAAQEPRVKRALELFDHVAIFILIAGSYTAFSLTILRDSVGWWFFGAVWAIAAFGIVMETLFLNRWPFLTLATYLAMGWLVVLAWKPLAANAPPRMLYLLIAGGLSYSIGTIFYSLGRRRGWFHVAWHFFVIAGTTCHFFSALAALPAA
jgi:hemolysin III